MTRYLCFPTASHLPPRVISTIVDVNRFARQLSVKKHFLHQSDTWHHSENVNCISEVSHASNVYKTGPVFISFSEQMLVGNYIIIYI